MSDETSTVKRPEPTPAPKRVTPKVTTASPVSPAQEKLQAEQEAGRTALEKHKRR